MNAAPVWCLLFMICRMERSGFICGSFTKSSTADSRRRFQHSHISKLAPFGEMEEAFTGVGSRPVTTTTVRTHWPKSNRRKMLFGVTSSHGNAQCVFLNRRSDTLFFFGFGRQTMNKKNKNEIFTCIQLNGFVTFKWYSSHWLDSRLCDSSFTSYAAFSF